MTKTAAETIEFVKAHLLAQGAKSMNDQGTCLYRGPEGRKCGVGALIPDELYDSQWDKLTIGVAVPERERATQEGPDRLALRDKLVKVVERAGFCNDTYMLCELQSIHDFEPIHMWASGCDALTREMLLRAEAK